MNKLFALGIFLGIFFGNLDAGAACGSLTLSNLANPTYSFNTSTTPSLNLTATKSHGSCSYFYTISYGSSTSYTNRKISQGSYTIPVNFYSDAAHSKVVRDLPDVTGNNDVISGNLSGGSSSDTLTYYPVMGASATYNRFGLYSDTYTISLYEGTTSSSTFRNSKTVTFNYTMPKVIDLSLVASGGAFNIVDTSETLSFGTLVTGAARSFDIVLKYNAGYTVKLSSANQGHLKHATLADLVPYSISVNSVTANLVGSNITPVSVVSGTGVSASAGLSLPSTVTIGSLGTARAGNYSDVITVTVVSSE